jgi:stage II sporulation protein D
MPPAEPSASLNYLCARLGKTSPGAEPTAVMARPRLLVAALALTALLAGSAVGTPATGARTRAQATTSPTFVVSGRGWGHGVGMAQWGAYGYAQQGWTYDQILAHYYQGTTLGPAQVSRVRVLLGQGRKRATVSSDAPFTVRDGIGQLWHVAEGPHAFGSGLRIKTTEVEQPQQLPGPLLFQPGTLALRLDGRPYRGQFQVSVANSALRVVNSVGLEGYLFGVVPSEMPHTWLPEALKAQAVAARSYALAVRKTGSWFDLYPDTRSQVYRGIAGEKPSATTAVQDTAGEVVLYGGRVATTYFFSSSGGRTSAASEVWPNSPQIPYLVSVDDPYDTISPHHRWGPFVVAAKRLKRVLRARGRLVDVRTATGPSGRVRTVTVVGSQGDSSVTGADARRALRLRSTWFRIGVLSLAPPQAPVTFGTQVVLSGVARSLPSVKLEQRQAGSAWQAVGPVAPSGDGTVSVSARPRAPTDYRLASGSARSTVAHVQVSPLVRFYGLRDSTSLRGYARPLFPGATVAVQRLQGDSWMTVVRATIGPNGDFEASLTLSPGEYRARLAPGRGFVPGVSPTLRVAPA